MLNRIFISLFRSLPLVTKDSDAQKPFSNHHSWVWKQLVSMKPLTTPSWSVMSISGKICMPTQSCLEVPPCTLALLTVCKRKSLPWHLLPWRSRSLLLLKGNTLSGSEAPSWHPCPPSNKCGSPSKNMTNPVLPSSTGSASKQFDSFPPLPPLMRHSYNPVNTSSPNSYYIAMISTLNLE